MKRSLKQFTAIALIAIVTLTGCAHSLQEIRERRPVQTGQFRQPHQALARCVFERLDAQTARSGFDPLSVPIYRLDEPSATRARVNALSTSIRTQAVFEIVFEPVASGATRVEFRAIPYITDRTEQRVWTIVTDCAATT